MKWFEGSINEAVTTSKSRKAIFVVFVEGKDDTSTQFAQAIDVTEVSTQLEHEDFVAIKLESGSEPYRFFAQIYHLVPVPSLFFIGENGIPLEIVAGNVTATELTSKIESVLKKAGKETKKGSQNLIESEKKSAACTNAPDASTSNVTTVNTPDTKVATDVPTETVTNTESGHKLVENESSDLIDMDIPTTSNETKVDNNATELSMQEKLDRAKQLIEVQKKQRQEEEERKEKEREMERRKMGRDVQKMRQKQQDLEVKQAHEERMKEKAAEAAAREKVRLQIAQDKLERKQKELALQQHVQQQPAEQPKVRPTSFADTTVTRIQFRLPSGNPHMAEFSPTNTLRTLRTYVTENINLPFRQFVMSTSFPRRDLTNEDDNKTLLELELVPRAVILILPLKNNNITTSVTSTQDVSFFSRFVWSFFAPVIGIYNYLMGYFTGTLHGNPDQNNEDTGNSSGASNSGDGPTFSNLQNLARSTGRNISIPGGATIRAQGNIHRLHSAGDDNDENNTWNGNSTQQM